MSIINRFKNLTDTKSVSALTNRFIGLETEATPNVTTPSAVSNPTKNFSLSNTLASAKPTTPSPLAFLGTEEPSKLKLPTTVVPGILEQQKKDFYTRTGAIQSIADTQKQITQPIVQLAKKPLEAVGEAMTYTQEAPAKLLSHPAVAPVIMDIAKRTSGTGMVSMVQAVGPKTFEEAYAANRAAQAGDPSKLNQFLYQLGDTVPQTAIGVALNFAPYGTGPALSTAYWTALSSSEQLERDGKVTSLTPIFIDVLGDSILGKSIESIFKAPAATLWQTIKQNFATEGGTEVAQDLLKMQANYINAKTPEEKAKILAEAKEYFKSGQILMTLGVGGISGAGIGAASQIGQEALEKYSKMTPAEKQSGKMKIPFAKQEAMDDEVISLEEEAKKYKTAEEFVKAQGKPLLHGGKDEIKIFEDKGSGGIHLTSDKEMAIDHANFRGNGKITEAYTKPKRVLSLEDSKKIGIKDIDEVVENPNSYKAEIAGIKGYGFDAIQSSDGKQLFVFNPKTIQTKSQLTDIWNKANAGSKLDPLAQEARKYKTADEFVKAQGTPVYHGSNEKIKVFSPEKGAQGVIWFTDNPKAITAGESGAVGTKFINERITTGKKFAGWDEYEKLGLGQIKDMGFDGIKLPTKMQDGTSYNDYILFDNKTIKTKSQLTDIWDQSNQKSQDEVYKDKKGVQPVTSQIPEASKAIVGPQNMANNKESKDFTPGPGYTKFISGLEQMVTDGKMYPEDLTILKTLFEGTNDDLLGKLQLTQQLIQKNNTRTLGRFSPIGSDRRSKENNISLRDRLTDMNQHPSRVFCHEFGHAGYAMVLTQEERHIVTEIYGSMGRAGTRRFFESGLDTNPTYHSKDVQEFFAQSFAEYIMEYRVPAAKMKPILKRLSESLFEGLKRLVNRGEQPAVMRLRPIFEKILAGDKSTPLSEFAAKEPPSFKQQLIELFKQPYPGNEPLFTGTSNTPQSTPPRALFNKPTPIQQPQTGENPTDAFQGVLNFGQQNLPPEIEIEPIEKVMEGEKRTPIEERVGAIDYYLRTPWRVLEKIGLKGHYQKLLKAYESYIKELPKNIDKITAWSKRVSASSNENIFRSLDGEKVTLTAEEAKVAGEIKSWLGEWADRLGMAPDARISEYITHIFPFGKGGEIPEEIAVLINKKIPGSIYDPFLLQRKGAEGYLKDTWKALDAYVKRATRKVNMDPALAEFKEAADKLSHVTQVNFATRFIGNINLRPTDLDVMVDTEILKKVGYLFGPRPVHTVTTFVRKMISRAKIGGSVTSFSKNLTQGVNTFAELGTKYTVIGYEQLVRNGGKELEENGVLISSFIEDRTYSAVKKLAEKTDKVLFMNMTASEHVNRGAAYYGAKAKFLAGKITSKEYSKMLGKEMPNGYTPTMEDAIQYGKAIAAKTQFLFSPLDTPVGMASDIAKTALQFQTFGVKQFEFVSDLIGDREYAKLARYLSSSMLLFSYIGSVFGMKWDDSLWPLRWGWPPALEFVFDVWGALIGKKDDFGNIPSREKRLKTVGKSLFTNIVPAGAQMMRGYEGIQTVNKGASITDSGTYQYPVAQTPMNYVRGALFGKANLPESKKYFDEKGTKKVPSNRFKGL